MSEFEYWKDEELTVRQGHLKGRMEEAEGVRAAAQYRYSQIEGELQDIGKEMARRKAGTSKRKERKR